jgi:hypothetical protein
VHRPVWNWPSGACLSCPCSLWLRDVSSLASWCQCSAEPPATLDVRREHSGQEVLNSGLYMTNLIAYLIARAVRQRRPRCWARSVMRIIDRSAISRIPSRILAERIVANDSASAGTGATAAGRNAWWIWSHKVISPIWLIFGFVGNFINPLQRFDLTGKLASIVTILREKTYVG